MTDRITAEVVDTIMEVISTGDGVIDVPQYDEGAFRKLCYFDDPDEIIPMEVGGDESEISFCVLCSEHVKDYGGHIAPFLYGIVRSLVKNIEPFPFGKGSPVTFDDGGNITFMVHNESVKSA